MCDKLPGGDMEQKLRTAYDLLMEHNRLHPDVSMWFTGEICKSCGKETRTDGKNIWCISTCIKDGSRLSPGTYAGIQEDYMR